ncbi:RAD52 family DNA repair protein [Cyanobium sp. WKJ7-Wakatipu]|uniref:RAD52 family DNA repair protein n=1 Tax=Cyanobium sp. WKJ7-Wakatipu TaxID=2823726 RepID=UPI0020CF041D|nr:RAD52 family DNA repair protein [Cyanobium sp. WKJ7-Wakatipu]MCP9784568.1 RAD52 family DNA repair protein [Cyanobium sp. WKJ7-Wakatipu]
MTVAAPSANGSSTSSRPAAPHQAQRPPSALEVIRSADRSDTETSASPTSAVEPQVLQTQHLGFSPEQLAALTAPLERAKVRQREQGRSRVSYLEGWQVIAEANRIFGFDGWQRQTIAVRCVAQAERLIGRDQKPGWGVTYTARVRITVTAGGLTPLVREGTGAGHGIDADLGQAHESAIKEAETDAMKRALMTFGNPFGLALYDKQQREVTSSGTAAPNANTRSRPAEAASLQQPQSPAQQEKDPSLDPLDPGTIQQILATVRGLPRPALEGFTKAFRKRFQVPEEAPSIADRICQRRHHEWIEAFLVQHQAQPETAAIHHG